MQTFKLFVKLSSYIRIRWTLTILAYICTFASMGLNMLQPFIFSRLIDNVLVGHHSKWLIPILSISLGVGLTAVVLNIFRDSLYRYLDTVTTLNLRNVLGAHLRKIPLAEIEMHGPGKFMPLLTKDTSTMSQFLNRILVEMTIQAVNMSVAVGIVFYMDWRLGLIVLVSIPLLTLIPRFFRKALTRVSSQIRSHQEEMGTYLMECVQGSREIRAFGLESWEERRNRKHYRELIAISTRETFYRACSGQSSALVISLIIVLLYAFGTHQVLNETLSIGMLVAAVQYFNSALRPIQSMNNSFADVKRSEVAMSHIEEFLKLPVSPMEMTTEEPSLEDMDTISGPVIECRDLYVSYENKDILKGVDVTVHSGQIAAFVGPSGSGKTTLLKTFMGFHPACRGELSVMGLPFAQWSRALWTRKIGMMFQESFIFAGTIYENIAMGDLTAAEEDVYQAACTAGLKEFIDSQPEGLHTRIGNQGFLLSGGQRQRLAIARVALHKPDILILDEPTSALDRATEEQVLSELHSLMQGKTTLISTHRFETIVSADIIYVLDHGEVVDQGTHPELLERCWSYRQLIEEQGRTKHKAMVLA